MSRRLVLMCALRLTVAVAGFLMMSRHSVISYLPLPNPISR